jgi:outer membrane lipase/esterase
MRHTNFALALLAAAVLSACGGSSGGGDQQLKTKFSAQVTFGDSLSDVGTYAVGTVKALGGGKYTINGNSTTINPALTGKNWTELMAAQFGLPAPCPAETGLDGNAAQGFSVPVVQNLNCTGYAQGGARVTNPVGPGNKLTGSAVGQLTVPVAQQIAMHLARNGDKFSGTEVVFVTAGGNDALELLGELSAAATAAGTAAGTQTYFNELISMLAANATDPLAAAQAIGAAVATASQTAGSTQTSITTVAIGTAAAQPGNAAVGQQSVYGPIVVKATVDAQAAGATAGAAYASSHGPALVTAMATAGTELGVLVKTQIVAKGANFVVVNNLPDLGSSPAAKAKDAATQSLINAMISAFNTQLMNGVSGEAKVLYVDLFSVSHDEVINPGPYGLTNTSTPACATNALLGSSLVCNASNVITGDVSHYMFADDVHPTPFEYALIAKYVAEKMIIKGWL